jgi:hypothetical protein
MRLARRASEASADAACQNFLYRAALLFISISNLHILIPPLDL